MGGIVDAITGGGSTKAGKVQAEMYQQGIAYQEKSLLEQLKLGRESLDLQKQMFGKAMEAGRPYRDTGGVAMAMYESLLFGTPVKNTASYKAYNPMVSGFDKSAADFKNELGGKFQGEELDKQVQAALAKQTSDSTAASAAQKDSLFAPYADMTGDPTEMIKSTPGYQFRMDEGSKALERSAAARSGSLSGAAAKAMERYGQDYASNEYGTLMSRIGGLVDTGAASAGALAGQAINSGNAQAGTLMGMANMNSNTANNVTGLLSNIGAARASGYLGRQAAGTNMLNMAASFVGGSSGGGGGGSSGGGYYANSPWTDPDSGKVYN